MQQITVQELKSRQDAGENIILVDVREDHEREEYNIGGIHHKLGDIQNMDTEALDGFKDKEVVIYCRSGKRSLNACLILESLGFENVVNLEGGILAWKEAIDNQA